MKFLAKHRMHFLRISILLVISLSIINENFRFFSMNLTNAQSLKMSIIGFSLVVFGSFGRIWASLYIEGNKTRNLVTKGPFSLVRNPLYFFSLIVLIGFCFGFKSIDLSISILLIFIIFHVPSIYNEENKLKKIHGNKFEEYMKNTPRLVPNIFKYKTTNINEKVFVRIKRINRILIQVIGYLFLYTAIDVFYFILN